MNLKYFLHIFLPTLLITFLSMYQCFGMEGRVTEASKAKPILGAVSSAFDDCDFDNCDVEGIVSPSSHPVCNDAIAALLNRPKLNKYIKENYPLVVKLLAKVNVDRLGDYQVIANINGDPFLKSLFIDGKPVRAAMRKGEIFYLTKDNLFHDLLLLESCLKSGFDPSHGRFNLPS